MTGPRPMRGRRLIVGLILVTVLVLPAIYLAGLLLTNGDKPARDLMFLIFYVAIALTLAANAAIALSLSLTATLAAPDQPPDESGGTGLAQRLRRIARRNAVPPEVLIGLMLAPMAVMVLGFGAWAFTTLYRAGNPLFLAPTALALAALSAVLLALMLLVSIVMFHRARKAAETEDPSAR